jgi:hypothetical protein
MIIGCPHGDVPHWHADQGRCAGAQPVDVPAEYAPGACPGSYRSHYHNPAGGCVVFDYSGGGGRTMWGDHPTGSRAEFDKTRALVEADPRSAARRRWLGRARGAVTPADQTFANVAGWIGRTAAGLFSELVTRAPAAVIAALANEAASDAAVLVARHTRGEIDEASMDVYLGLLDAAAAAIAAVADQLADQLPDNGSQDVIRAAVRFVTRSAPSRENLALRAAYVQSVVTAGITRTAPH